MGETMLYGGFVPSEAGRRLGQLADGLVTAQVAAVTARLGLAGHLAGGPRTAAELAEDTATDPDALGRLLRAAAAIELLTLDANGRFGLTETGALLGSDADGSIGPILSGIVSPVFWHLMGGLEDAVRIGQAANVRATGTIYDCFQQRPEDAGRLARAMSTITARLSAEVVAAYDPSGLQRIVDVGGSRGTLLGRLLQRAPAATGVLFDHGAPLADAPAVLAACGVADRVEVVDGNFLEAVPQGGDLYIVSQALHNFDDADVRTVLGNCHRASRAESALLVIEPIVPSGPEPSSAHLLDIIVMTATEGRERTREQHEALAAAAGYAPSRDIPLSAGFLPWHVLEFRRV